MDAVLWHRLASAQWPAAPAPIDVAELSRLSVTERQSRADEVKVFLKRVGFESPRHRAAVDAIDRDVRNALLEPPGARTIIALSAPATAGKSTVITRWSLGLTTEWLDDRDAVTSGVQSMFVLQDVPVCYLTLTAGTTSKALYEQLLAFLCKGTGHSESKLAVMAAQFMHQHHVRLVVIDDVNLLTTTDKAGIKALEAIKHINTALGYSGGVLVLVGINLVGRDVLEDPQVKGRLLVHELSNYRGDTDYGIAEWMAFLRRTEPVLLPYLPYNGPGDIVNKLARYLDHRTQGFVGTTARLLVEGVTTAIEQDRPLERTLLDTISTDARSAQETYLRVAHSRPVAKRSSRRAR